MFLLAEPYSAANCFNCLTFFKRDELCQSSSSVIALIAISMVVKFLPEEFRKY